MQKRLHIYITALLTCLAAGACTADDPARQEAGGELLEMDMTICLQPDDAMATRAPGDPGTYEHFHFPRYFYVYAVCFSDAGGDFPAGKVVPLNGGAATNRKDMGSDAAQWEKYYMYVDPPQTLNDSIYGSRQSVAFSIPTGTTKIKFYVAASPTALKLDGTELGVGDNVLGSGTHAGATESDVLNLMFDVDDDLKDHLEDLYASPHNYAPGGTYNNEYYYTINNPKSGDITRIIYHVAAKVDVQWNVAANQQPTNRITYMEARRLKRKNCLLFRPAENTWTTADNDDANDANGTENYSLPLMADDVSSQWYGRRYFYTIPYGSTFDICLHLLKNGDAAGTSGYNLKLQKDVSPFTIFTPWIRADLRFTSPITYGNVVKTL